VLRTVTLSKQAEVAQGARSILFIINYCSAIRMANKMISVLFLVSVCFASGINGLIHLRDKASGREDSLGFIDSHMSGLQHWWPATTTMASHEEYAASQTSKANNLRYMESHGLGVIRDTEKSGVLPQTKKRLVSRQGNHHVYQLRLIYDSCCYYTVY
jgi:hypothetical protein